MRASVLESRVGQSKAMEQFWLSRDEEILGEVLNVGLHLSLRTYLVRGVLMEQEIFGRMEQVRSSYLKLQEELATQKTDFENALQSLSAKENELVDWRREMEVQESMFDSLKVLNG
ncbi:uncharacterized protein A4U43_C02F8360 [Asparagus officinalis]|uniref:Uncharacterized protein n=1 Tax=Asparagus officinalis TaxID=4686 RepID=A0A5P1FLY5_ASPOF|nr:uncharacterized protein A4U43_C02F8360 [Asparagus officinalis]